MAQAVKVAMTSEIPRGGTKVVEAGGRIIALFNCGGQFYATDNACKHQGGPLAEGILSRSTISCPWHGWEYDVTSGACQTDPSLRVESFEVKVEGEEIFLSL